MVEIQLLGSLNIRGPNGRSAEALARQSKRVAILAHLALARPRGFHRRDKLVGIFWPELDDVHARNALSQALHVIRRALGNHVVVARGDEISLEFEAVRCDALEFERALDGGDPEQAMLLYRGDLLDGLFVPDAPAFEEWLDAERRRFRSRAGVAAWALAADEAHGGDPGAAEHRARHAMELGTADESALRQVLQRLHERGERAAALQLADEFARYLSREYELQPSSETLLLVDRVRQLDATAGGSERTRVGAAATETAPRRQQSNGSGARQRSRLGLLAGVVAVAAAAWYVTMQRSSASPVAHLPRVAIMPLRNLGSEQNAYFADGVTEEIKTRLAMVGGLSVVGGRHLLPYRASGRTQRQIAGLLGADYLLDGSASWQPAPVGRGRLRVLITLTAAGDSLRSWGNVFEREIENMQQLSDLFADIAQRVVNDLDLVLRSPAPSGAQLTSTSDLEAYGDYLRGRAYLNRTATGGNHLAAIRAFRRATHRDRRFALAWAWLGNAHVEANWVGGLPQEHLDSAKAALDAARALRADLADVHSNLAYYYYVCCENYERARFHLGRALAGAPDDAHLLNMLGNVRKRGGDMGSALPFYRRANQRDPLWHWPEDNLGHAQLWMRRYDDAETTFRRRLAEEPQNPFAYAHLALVLVLRDGDLEGAARVLESARRSAEGLNDIRLPFDLAMMSRDWARALAALRPPGPGLTESLLNEWLVSDHIRGGLARRFARDTIASRRSFDSARIELESALAEAPRSRRIQLLLRSGLAMAHAGLGDATAAQSHMEFVRASNPLEVDAIEGPKYLLHLAVALVMLGERSAAIDVLETLAREPGLVSEHSLRLEPYWDLLRDEPRFQRLRPRRL